MNPSYSKAAGTGGQGTPDRSALPAEVCALAEAAAAQGGRAWVVGGWVRDALLGHPGKDVDVEVHGLKPRALERVLRAAGGYVRVGRSFDVYKLRAAGGDIDVSLAQLEGADAGLQDPLARLRAAAGRRDLTINAIAFDPITGALVDPFRGREDLRSGVLRAVDPATFLEDPLRALRVVQFAARFGCTVDPVLGRLCRTADLGAVAPERVAYEVEKLLLKADAPSVGLRLGRRLGIWSGVAPEVAGADPDLTGAAVDRAVQRRADVGPSPRPLALALGALLHALPPAQAEVALNRLRGLPREGYPLHARVLGALNTWRGLLTPPSDAALRALAETEEVALVCALAWTATGAPHTLEARARADALGVSYTPLPPLLFGRDLAALGIPAGPEMGAILSQVRAAQIQGTVCNPEAALRLASALAAAPHPLR